MRFNAKVAFLLLALTPFLGCSDSVRKKQSAEETWRHIAKRSLAVTFKPRDLSLDEHRRKMHLIHELIGKHYVTDDDLDRVFVGNRMSDFAELLSYADEFSSEGSLSRYYFIILQNESSDPTNLQEADGTMVIGVDDQLIVGAGCAINES